MSPSLSFQQRINNALKVIEQILETTKNPQLIEDVDHQYEDKYTIVECMTNTSIASILNVLEKLDGFNKDVLNEMIKVVKEKHRSVTLRLNLERKCEFSGEKIVEIESPRYKTEKETAFGKGPGIKTVTSHKIITEVKEYHWKVTIKHEISLFTGTDCENSITLGSRTGSASVVTRMRKNPLPSKILGQHDVILSGLFQWIDPACMKCSFAINREQAKTPTQNQQVEEIMDLLHKLVEWSSICSERMKGVLHLNALHPRERAQYQVHRDQFEQINSKNVFVPILPLFMHRDSTIAQIEIADETADYHFTMDDPKFYTITRSRRNDFEMDSLTNTSIQPHGKLVGATQLKEIVMEHEDKTVGSPLVILEEPSGTAPLIAHQDLSLLLKEQFNSLEAETRKLEQCFPSASANKKVITRCESKLVLLWSHLVDLATQCVDGIQYIEDVLYRQLIKAIGKEVDAKEFDMFLKFRNQQLFSSIYSPRPFCYAIRQPNQYPDGILSIVAGGIEPQDHIETFVKHISDERLSSSILIPLNAATTIEFTGDQYLHGWLDTHFASRPASGPFYLSARARQFSCFVLLIGQISGPNEFTPTDAIILQDKDEILIPLILTDLPSAKEFKDAIVSLSPEQARFAQSFRSMKLDSSVFGICIIQVKPQLESLLDLPLRSLSKEIQLTQDLLSLFVTYQIPPTLLSYDGPESLSLAEKVFKVKTHVKTLHGVIQKIKDDQLKEEVQKADVRFGTRYYRVPRRQLTEEERKTQGISDALAWLQSNNDNNVEIGCDLSSLGSYNLNEEIDSLGFHKTKETSDIIEEKGISRVIESDLSVKTNAEQKLEISALPKKLDKVFEQFDGENALRNVTISTGDEWKRKHQINLLTPLRQSNLGEGDQQKETNKALDLLDTLSRSGSLPIVSGEMHVIIGVRHSFEQSVMDTVIKKNLNPIEKVDFSSLLIASSIHNVSIPTLLADNAELPTQVLCG